LIIFARGGCGLPHPVANADNVYKFGQFMGERYKNRSNIVWVLGGDIHLPVTGSIAEIYRSLAEGIGQGMSRGARPKWNDPSDS